jgi:asparagine synthase (glutamine-hydrolysing)
VALAAGSVQGTLRTFSIGFAEEAWSELPFARQVARRFGTEHVEEVITPDAVSLLGKLTQYYDEPFADSSAIPTYLVAQLAKRSVKVVLTGDGGDEAFGGYARYSHDLKEAALRRFLPAWFRRLALGPLARFWPKADWLPRRLRAKTLLTNLSLDAGAAYANTLTQCRRPLRRQLLAEDLKPQLNGHDPGRNISQVFDATAANDPLGGMIAADVGVLLPDDFLVKVDRATMAWGLEARPPLLDHELLELAGRIPSEWKVRHGKTKWVFKQICRQVLPDGMVDRPKHGFDMPIDSWLRSSLRDVFHSAVLSPHAPVAGLVDQGVARKLFFTHERGTARNGAVLWSLLVLARWAERYLSSAADSTTNVLSAPQ